MSCAKKRAILAVGLILLAAACFGGALLARRNAMRNGVVFGAPSVAVDLSAGTVCYKQNDERWADDALGDSRFHMRDSGCLVTCAASAVSTPEAPVTPGELNALLSENGCYDGEGNLLWEKFAALDGFAVKKYDGVKQKTVEDALQSGVPVIVRVRLGGAGPVHYVLIVGAADGHFLCMDPLRDDMTLLDDYGNRVYAVRTVKKSG